MSLLYVARKNVSLIQSVSTKSVYYYNFTPKVCETCKNFTVPCPTNSLALELLALGKNSSVTDF